MKHIRSILCLFLVLFALAACSPARKDPLHLWINAVITRIDAANETITVRDSDEGGPLGEACSIDCSEIFLIYCNYETGDVKDISFADLQVGDEVLLSVRESVLDAFQAGEGGESTLQIEQLQLGTQRLE